MFHVLEGKFTLNVDCSERKQLNLIVLVLDMFNSYVLCVFKTCGIAFVFAHQRKQHGLIIYH